MTPRIARLGLVPVVAIWSIGVACAAQAGGAAPAPRPAASACDAGLWRHVYPGKFARAQDRLHVIRDCVTVTGFIETAKPRPDGDVHIRLRLDPQFATLLNAQNMSEQRGDLVVEPVCVTRPTKRRTVEQGSCDNFSQSFDPSLVGRHVRVVGAHVTDVDNGWNEIHPVTSITPD